MLKKKEFTSLANVHKPSSLKAIGQKIEIRKK
jgi:hypothetical protein